MNTLSQIQSEVAALPVNLQAEVLDFVQFVKQRRGLPTALPAATPATSAAPEGADSPFFRALTEAGVVGCIATGAWLTQADRSSGDACPLKQ